jgi:pyridoxamine 5'-phosphate oxidase family protein
MSVFTDREIDYLTSHTLGRLATVGPDAQPHVVPVSYRFNPDEDSIDIGGMDFGASKKWRDARHNPRVTFLVDDASQTEAHAIEIRGEAELHETGGDTINPRFPNFKPQFLRIRPRRIVSWWVNEPGPEPGGRNVDRGLGAGRHVPS